MENKEKLQFNLRRRPRMEMQDALRSFGERGGELRKTKKMYTAEEIRTLQRLVEKSWIMPNFRAMESKLSIMTDALLKRSIPTEWRSQGFLGVR